MLDGVEAENWGRAVMLLETVEATELIGPHVGPDQRCCCGCSTRRTAGLCPQPVRFGCTCGPEKVVQSLAIYSAEEIAGMITPEGKVTADCQFCGAHYEFDPAELGCRTRPETRAYSAKWIRFRGSKMPYALNRRIGADQSDPFAPVGGAGASPSGEA